MQNNEGNNSYKQPKRQTVILHKYRADARETGFADKQTNHETDEIENRNALRNLGREGAGRQGEDQRKFKYGNEDVSDHVVRAPCGSPRHAGVAEGGPELLVRDSERTEVGTRQLRLDLKTCSVALF